MTCYRVVRVRPSSAPKVAVAWIVGARRGLGRGCRTAQGLPDDEPRDGPADEGQGDDGDPGGLGHATKLAGRGQNGVCQTVQPEAHHEEGEQGTGQQHGRSLTSAVYAMGGITPTSPPALRARPFGSSDDVTGELVIRWRSGQQSRRTVYAAKAVRPHPSARSFPQVSGRGGGGFRNSGQASPQRPSQARTKRPRTGRARTGRPRRAGPHRRTLARRPSGRAGAAPVG